MDKDRTRPFLLEPVYHGAPISWAEKFFRERLKQYRANHPEFDEYLTNVSNEIKSRKLTYCENLLLFLNGEAKTNWISPRKSLFRLFIKFFNYDFSAKQTVDYIERCHATYEFLLKGEYELSSEYKIFSKTCNWDNNTRDFVKISLVPTKSPKDWDDYYWIDITFCSLQEMECEPDFFCDTEIKISSGREIYDDTLCLFEHFQGCKLSHKCLDFAISELIKYKVINEPSKITNRFTTLLFYKINKPNYLEIQKG